MSWQQINLLCFFVAGISAFLFKNHLLRQGRIETGALTWRQIAAICAIAALNPIVAGPVFYYGLKDCSPAIARQANKISIIAFTVELMVAGVYLLTSGISASR